MVNRNRFKIRLELLKRRQRSLFAKLVRASRGEAVKLGTEEKDELAEAAIVDGDGLLSREMSALVLAVHEKTE